MIESGFLLNVAKPAGMTSRDVVNRLVRAVGEKRMGHAGTLDPAAEGVLVVAVGTATRLVEYVQRLRKRYRADVRLGEASDTDDAEGTITARVVESPPTLQQVKSRLADFVGEIQQVPPAYSAIKVQGRRAYSMARAGDDVPLEPRKVAIHSIELVEYCYPLLRLEVCCGGGTYIRSLARDLGEVLGVGGLLKKLVRTAIGPFTLEQAAPLDALLQGQWKSQRLPLATAVAALPRIVVDEQNAKRFQWGQWFPALVAPPDAAEGAVWDPQDRFLGVATIDAAKGRCRASKGGFLIEDAAAPPAEFTN